MNQINISMPLGRLALEHSARPGQYLEQDANRAWRIEAVSEQRPLLQRFIQHRFIKSRVVASMGSLMAGVVIAMAYNFATNVAVPKPLGEPALSLAPKTISLAAASYPEEAPDPTRLPVPVAKLPAAAPSPLAPKQVLPNPSASRNSVPDDGKLAVFNEAPSQPAKATVQVQPATPQALPVPQLVALAQPALLVKPSPAAAAGGSAKPGVRMLAVQSATSIVVTNPSTRLPIIVKVGDSLPDGSTLKSIDKTASTAQSSRGDVLTLQ